MGKRLFWTGIVLGAVAGGLTALLDKDARIYLGDTVSQAKSTTQFYMNNPSEAVSGVRTAVRVVSENLDKGTDAAMDALAKLDQSIDDKRKKEHIELIE